MNSYVHQNPRLWGSYAAEVQNVRQYMKNRIAWMDRKLNYVYTPSGITSVADDSKQPSQVYTLQGRACGSRLDVLPPGVYIVRQGTTVKKVTVR